MASHDNTAAAVSPVDTHQVKHDAQSPTDEAARSQHTTTTTVFTEVSCDIYDVISLFHFIFQA